MQVRSEDRALSPHPRRDAVLCAPHLRDAVAAHVMCASGGAVVLALGVGAVMTYAAVGG